MTATPARFLTYKGDHRGIVGSTLGPNALGEFLTAVTADYNGTTTRVGFSYTPRAEAVAAATHEVTETAFGRTVREATR